MAGVICCGFKVGVILACALCCRVFSDMRFKSCRLRFRTVCTRLVTARKRSLRRLCFHRCLFVPTGGGGCLSLVPEECGRQPPWQTTPRQTSPGQTPLLGRHPSLADTPRQTPPGQTHPGRHSARQTPPRADTTPGQTPCAVHAGIQSTSGRYASH